MCIARGLFIPALTEARVPQPSCRRDLTADNADTDGNRREGSATQAPLDFFLPKTKSLTMMHHSIPFNFISGDRLQIPDHVWSLELPPGLRGTASPHSQAMVIAEHAALLPSLPGPLLHHPRVLPTAVTCPAPEATSTDPHTYEHCVKYFARS